jgi:gluconokinase
VIIVVMGVAGSGKTSVGAALAGQLAWPFFDADDFHPPENIAAMSGGVPLSDAEREPWLEALRGLLQRLHAEGRQAVLACSALRAHFRERLRAGAGDVRYVYLRADRELLARRLTTREGHFMPPALLDSQFAALEEPEGELTVDAAQPPEQLVDEIRSALAV